MCLFPFIAVPEVIFYLLQRAAFGFWDVFVGKEQAQKTQACEDEEGGGQAEGGEEHREGETDAEVGEPEAEHRDTHAHAADAGGEELGQQEPGDGGEEALLEEEEGDGEGQHDIGQALGSGENAGDKADGAEAAHGANLPGHEKRPAAMTAH